MRRSRRSQPRNRNSGRSIRGPGSVEHDPEDIWATAVATVREAMAKAGVGAQCRRHRHHQSARDHDRLGSRDRTADPQRHRLAGSPHGRPLRSAAHGRARAVSRPSAPGFCSIRISPPPKLPGCSITWTARRSGARGTARVRHRRQLPLVAADGRQGSRDRRHQRGAHAALRYPHRAVGRRSLRALFGVPMTMLPQVRDCSRRFRRPPTCSAGRSAFLASPAISRRRRWGRAVFARA